MRIDVWSDFLCPFCHLGRRQLELALEQFEHGDEIDVVWHSFQLDRGADAVIEGSNVQRVADKYGVSVEQMEQNHRQMAESAAEVGLDFQWDKVQGGNSYDAHRLHHFARSVGREREFMDTLMTAWYSGGAAIGDHATLLRLAVEAGLDEQAARGVLESDSFGADVRTDLALAHQIGITAVPTFVLDQKFGVSGAQGVEPMIKALSYAWDDQGNRPEPAGGGCGGGCCGGGCGGGAQDAEAADPEAALEGGCGCGGGVCGTHEDAHQH